MKAVIGNLKRFFERFKKENQTIQISIPIIGVTANIPLSEAGILQATRKGIDKNDIKTPFVQSATKDLIIFYEQYKNSKEYKFSRSPYAETIPLKQDNDGFHYGVNVEDFIISTINAQYRPPIFLMKHYNEAINLFKSLNKIRKDKDNKWENNSCIRISEWNSDTKTITIQPATYFDQVGTNLSIDWASGLIDDDNASTIRNTIESNENGMLPRLKNSILANTLGVAVVLINKETKEVLIPIRGSEQAIMSDGKGKFHCSASGVFELDDFPIKGEKLTFDIFMQGMKKEIKEEIGLSTDSYKLIPLAFTRELARGGKPQLFFIAETKLDIKSIKSSMINAINAWEFINENDLPNDSQLKKYLNAPLEAPQELFTYEGWMALRIASAYINKEEPPFTVC